MTTELENLGAPEEGTPPLEPKVEPKVELPAEPAKDSGENLDEVKAKEEEKLANIRKAVTEEQERLRTIRNNQKKAKLGIEIEEEEEATLQIDKNDPSSKAWLGEINKASAPARDELEKAKEERRLYTLRKFLSDKPSLASSPERVKEMMEVYDRLKTATELTSEGIEEDLEKAYAATHYKEIISGNHQARVDNARKDIVFSDPGVSRGSTAVSNDTTAPRVYSDEEKAILAKWDVTPAEHAEMEAAMKKNA